jgi:hypothetical protein
MRGEIATTMSFDHLRPLTAYKIRGNRAANPDLDEI